MPTPLTSGALVQALVDGLRVRDEPGLDATPVARLSAGQRARVVDGPQDADGYRWYQLSLMPSDVSGWVAAGEGSTPWIAAVLNGKILLTSGRDIWTVDQDGDRELFAGLGEGWNAGSPSWAPDGGALAITELRQDADLGCVLEGGVAVLDDTGRVIARSSPPPGTYDSGPAWSRDGSQIAFTRVTNTCATQNPSGVDDLYVMTVASGEERVVVSHVNGAVWSPAGDTFAFLRFDALRGWEIWMIAADGSRERLLGGNARLGAIAWSPDGSVLAYTRAVGNDLGTVEFDLIDSVGNMRALTSHPGFVSETFTWLPDGSSLAYYEQEVGGFTISVVVLSSDGTEFARFEQSDGVPNRVVVSPDGSTLAWGIQGSSDLRIQLIAGGDARTFTVAPNADIAWQPLLAPSP